MHKTFKKNIYLFLITLCALVQIIGCGGTDSKTNLDSATGNINLDYGRIKGIVSASGSKVLSNAIVETFQAQATTASDGSYLLGPIPAGDYKVTARYSGYAPYTKDKVRVYPGKITENIDFSLTYGSASSSANFAVMSIVPRLGTDGELVSVFCKGCGKSPGKVFFNGKEGTIISWNKDNDDRIMVQAPANVESGPVTVEINGEKSHESQQVIFIGKPIIFSASPSIAKGNQKITLTGRNFNSIAAFNHVNINNLACTVLDVTSSTSMDIRLPENAKTGLLSIKIWSDEFQLDGISDFIETIQPAIVYLSPQSSIPGVPLTVYGYNFGTDKTMVKILFGNHQITSNEFLNFTDNKISFTVPDNTVLPAGQKAKIRVQVNQSQSNALTYTAYNTVNNTLTKYGIYNFNSVSSGGTLHLPCLKPTDRIAFLSVMSGDGTQALDGDYSFLVNAILGGNYSKVPTLPTANMRASNISNTRNNIKASLTNFRLFAKTPEIRASLGVPASKSISLYLRDFRASDPWDATNDILATATLKATSTHALVYFDIKIAGLTDADAQRIGKDFDDNYAQIATSCSDGITAIPEGNIDSQPKIAIFVSPTLNQSLTSTIITSYFDPRDKDSSQPHSAGTEILYANSETYKTDPVEVKSALAASLESMMYFNQKSPYRTVWENAALQIFARQEVGTGFKQDYAGAIDWVGSYLTHSSYASLTHWPSQPAFYNYGMEYLFIQYLFDRCKGYNAIAALEKKNGALGVVDINTNIIGAGLAVPPSPSFKEFFQDFCKALYCDHLNLPVGFPGYDEKKDQFKSIQIRGKNSQIDGLKGVSYYEDPIYNRTLTLKGFGCTLFEYNHGNWGDLKVSISATPTDGDFKTWVIYYSNTKP